jgi:hypothetical protein
VVSEEEVAFFMAVMGELFPVVFKELKRGIIAEEEQRGLR